MSERIGFIGLGNVGGKLAANLLAQGATLTVRDLDRAATEPLVGAGASRADSARELAASSDIVITCLPSPSVSAAVMEDPDDGVLAGLRPGALWLEMSTTSEEEVHRLGALVEAAGSTPLDSPVSGGCHRAATGNISIFAGGERTAFERALPVLAMMGRNIVHTGPLGSASVLKVITNYLAGLHLLGLGEALTVAKQAGLDLAMVYEGIRVSSGNSFVHETESQVILNGSYNINFTMDLEVKDLSLFQELGTRHGVPLELSPVAVDIVRDGLDRYGPRSWSPMIVKRLEEACGIELRAPGFPAELIDREPPAPGREVKPGE